MKNKLKKILFFSALATLILHIINKIISSIAVFKDLLTKGYGNYYEWRFGKIFYTKQGTGSPLLLLHDLDVCSSSYEWNEMVKSLSKENTVYAIDLLGCGRSDKPNLTYTNFLYVQMLSDFIKNVIGHKTNIIASGFSGSFTLMTCNNENELINKIILINPDNISKINKTPGKRSKTLKFLLNMPVIGTTLYNILINKRTIEQMFESRLFFNSSKINEKYIESYYEASQLQSPNAKFLLSSLRGNYLNANIVHALKAINNSIYIIGSSELADNISIVQNYVFYNPSIETVFISKTGKLPHIEDPVKTLKQIRLFLS